MNFRQTRAAGRRVLEARLMAGLWLIRYKRPRESCLSTSCLPWGPLRLFWMLPQIVSRVYSHGPPPPPPLCEDKLQLGATWGDCNSGRLSL
ncbi:hypothetical protein CGRA01v4_04777 [Colletotrichum graminicola]|nr:hypothetical protein CGRA01v4_04777 [Colletotrichum graminicola]